MNRSLLLFWALAGLAGCSEYNYSGRTQTDVFQQVRRNTVDILMVVDNSCSMIEEQVKLGGNFQNFIQAFQGVDVDWQIAVTTTDTLDPAQSGHLIGGTDEIKLLDAQERTLDRVAYDASWGLLAGVALQLDVGVASVTGNDVASAWCPATESYGDGDRGTPGAANGACGASGPTPPPEGDTGTSDTGDTGGSDGGSDGGGGGDAVQPAPGDVLITEFMPDPSKVSDTLGEWVELTSFSASDVDLGGAFLADEGGNRFQVPAGTILPAGGRLVIARSVDAAANGGVPAQVAAGPDFTLNNDIRVLTPDTDAAGEIFGEMVAVGVEGSGIETGLAAAKLALDEPLRSGANAGFLRDAANRSIIFVSDEEDYSAERVDDYLRFFKSIKGEDAFRDDGLVNISAVVGKDLPPYEGQPSCESESGVAGYGTRYVDLASRTGGALESICDDDFAPIATELGLTVSGLGLEFALSEPCDESTLVVRLYESPDERDFIRALERDVDYAYSPEKNAIVFTSVQVPPSEHYITATYRVLARSATRSDEAAAE